MAKTKVKNLTLGTEVVTDVTAADLGLSTAYVPKGSISVSAANGASVFADKNVGEVYNMSDSGEIAGKGIGGGSFHVSTGDNIVVVEETVGDVPAKRWDKLSATIATYTGSGPVTVGSPSNGVAAISVAVGSNIADSSNQLAVSLKKANGNVALGDATTVAQIVNMLGGELAVSP